MPYYAVSSHRAPKLSAEQQHLKQALIDTGEEWSATWQNILSLDPHYFAAYVKLRSVPTMKQHLPRKVQELILLAIDASCTHLFEAGVRAHLGAALKAGASKSEIMEVLELTSVLGLHALNIGMPLLVDVLEERGQGHQLRSANGSNLSEYQQQLRTSLQQRKDGDGGFWAATGDALFALCPAYLEAGAEFTSLPHSADHGKLDPMTKELIYVAIDCATSYIRQAALKTHIRNALNCGATAEQVTTVFELAGLMGVRTVCLGADVLTQETSVRKIS